MAHYADHTDCQLSEFCAGQNGNGTCQPDRVAGEACLSVDECSSGYCVDGVCCGSTCGVPCYTCALPGFEGVCSPQRNATFDRRGCGTNATTKPCGFSGECDGEVCPNCGVVCPVHAYLYIVSPFPCFLVSLVAI
jgi:Dickkopf-like protein